MARFLCLIIDLCISAPAISNGEKHCEKHSHYFPEVCAFPGMEWICTDESIQYKDKALDCSC